jgi:uncharacterized membrane protein YedE/YeeE
VTGARAAARPYADPYLTGIGLGLVLLAAFVLVGRGLGASGAFAAAAASVADGVAGSAARDNAYFADHLGGGLLHDWLVVEVIGVVLGGFASAALAGRVGLVVERGAHTMPTTRLVLAAVGGAIMGLGAVLARGCTSGQALTGGALLSVGSWVFVGATFAAGYAVAALLRRFWT